MAEADDRLQLCRMILGDIGTRSTITSLDPPDGSPEAFYCNLLFDDTRDTLLRAAHWGFAGRSDMGVLWKALPGTPENPAIPANYQWSVRDPAPPWLYSYVYPGGGGRADTIQIRRLRGQQQQASNELNTVPFYGGVNSLMMSHVSAPCAPFEVGLDGFDQAGNSMSLTQKLLTMTVVNGGTGYMAGDYITLTGGGSVYGSAPIVQVALVASGAVQSVATTGAGGSFIAPATSPMTQSSTSGSGSGFTGTGTFVAQYSPIKVILTNAQNAIIDFTTSLIGVLDWDAGFQNAFMSALEGRLALALLGDKEMHKMKLQEANNDILDARVRDANEGLTAYDFVPDWLQVRGVSSMTASREWFNPPYGPLFAV